MARPIAPRFEIIVLKNKNASDDAQIPAGDATITFYRAGATVKGTSVTIIPGDSKKVDAYDLGRVSVGDTVRVGTDVTKLLTVVTPDPVLPGEWPVRLKLSNSGTAAITLQQGDRLVPTNNQPNAYMDPLATVSLGNWINVDPDTGRSSAYLSSDRVDYDVAIPGEALRLFIDGAGVFGRSDQSWTDLRDFGGDLQTAINALPPEGGTIFVPRGTWILSAGVTVNVPNVTIIGEQLNTVIRPEYANTFDLITVNSENFQMRDVMLDGLDGLQDPTGKSCLVVLGSGSVGLQNVSITGAPRCGLYLKGPSLFIAEACHFSSNAGSGARVEWVGDPAPSTTQFVACAFNQNGDRGCEASNVPLVTFLGCVFDGNRGGVTSSQGNGIDATGCTRIEILSSFFMNSNGIQPLNQLVSLNQCTAAVVDGCSFDGGPFQGQGALQAVRFSGSNSSRITNCTGKGLVQYLALFSASLDCVEFGNSEFGLAWPRISVAEIQRFIGLSRGSALAPESQDVNTLYQVADEVLPGALASATRQLFVWNGTQWKQVTLT